MFALPTILLATIVSSATTNLVYHGTAVAILKDANILVLKADNGSRSLFLNNDGFDGIMAGDRLSVEIVPPTKRLNRRPRTVKSIAKTGRGTVEMPTECSIGELQTDAHHLDLVRFRGFVEEIVRDEIAPDWIAMVVRASNSCVLVTIPYNDNERESIWNLRDTEVDVTGLCIYNQWGFRMFGGMRIRVESLADIRPLSKTTTNRFAVPELAFNSGHSGIDVSSASALRETRRAFGDVLARWGGRHMLIRLDNGYISHVELAYDGPMPPYGTRIEVVGQIATDMFHINFTHARYKILDACQTKATPPRRTSARNMQTDVQGRPCVQFKSFGELITLSGLVTRELPTDGLERRFELQDEGFAIPVDVSEIEVVPTGLRAGCTVEVTGTFLFESDNWTRGTPPPHIRGVVIVPRTADDIHIISQPPWWTPTRLLGAICALVVALLAIIFWNRSLNRLANRRGEQLFREQIAHAGADLRVEERTRLAVELHDSLSQNLSGVGFQITAAKSKQAKNPEESRRHLDTAERMLTSCRTELRRCLWDLREDTLAESDFQSAVSKTVNPVSGNANISIHISVPRTLLSDTTAHAILRILRELVANAVTHGKATQIQITGARKNGNLSFSVSDNGCGFDPLLIPGAASGHFGLAGIEERLTQCGGTFTLESSVGKGTRAVATIPVHHESNTTAS